MANLKAQISKQTTKDGKDIDLTATGNQSDGRAFLTVAPDYYTAVVRKIEVGEYQATWGEYKNPETPDGKWTYMKLIPDIQLVNDNGTLINRQDLTLGVVFHGAPYRPDGKANQSPIFGGKKGAQFMLSALGLIVKNDDGEFDVDFDPELITDRVVRVRTGVGGYIKGKRGFDADEMLALLTEVNDGDSNYSFDDIPALVDAYNLREGYVDEDGTEVTEGVRLKTKSVITGWYPLSAKQAEEAGYFRDARTGAVYLTEASYNEYLSMVAMGDNNELLTDPQSGW